MRDRNEFGLHGGEALTRMAVDGGAWEVSAFDEDNCFTGLSRLGGCGAGVLDLPSLLPGRGGSSLRP